MKKFALLLAGAGIAALAAGFAGKPASAATLMTTDTGAVTVNATVQKVGWHSRWRSHYRWGSRGGWHNRWRSHHRWGSRHW